MFCCCLIGSVKKRMEKRKPVIGIAAQYDETEHRLFLVEHYEQAVFLGGGIPVLLPLHASRKELLAVMRWCDGFLLPGGPDLSPFLFGEEAHEGCGRILPERDYMECMIVREALGSRLHCEKPLLGICRGIQVINVAMGGSIYQDMWEQRRRLPEEERLAHWQTARAAVPTHTVCLEPSQIKEMLGKMTLRTQNRLSGHKTTDAEYAERHWDAPADGWLLGLLGGKEEIKTNSFHHQAIKQVAEGFAICGMAKDGTIEAIHKQGHPFCLGVQWHPEDLLAEEGQRRIFEVFVEKASEG